LDVSGVPTRDEATLFERYNLRDTIICDSDSRAPHAHCQGRGRREKQQRPTYGVCQSRAVPFSLSL